MLLAVDVGNSETVVALFEGETLRHHWRLTSSPRQTGDELSVLFHYVLSSVGASEGEITGVAVSSVVPGLTPEYRVLARRLFDREALVIDHRTVPDLPILYHDPASVGGDRLANAAAVIAAYGAPAIVVDLGTATTLDVVTADREYAGGVIAPGIATSANALFTHGARLARVEIRRPAHVVGRTTEESMQAGIFYGAVGSVDALVRAVVRELSLDPGLPVVATGGLASAIAAASETITAVDEALTVNGIRLIWERRGRP
jgi:type III pantothenate kinase